MKSKSEQEIEMAINLHEALLGTLHDFIIANTSEGDEISTSFVIVPFLLAAFQINRDFGAGKDFGDVARTSIPLMAALDEQIQILKKMEEDLAN